MLSGLMPLPDLGRGVADAGFKLLDCLGQTRARLLGFAL